MIKEDQLTASVEQWVYADFMQMAASRVNMQHELTLIRFLILWWTHAKQASRSKYYNSSGVFSKIIPSNVEHTMQYIYALPRYWQLTLNWRRLKGIMESCCRQRQKRRRCSSIEVWWLAGCWGWLGGGRRRVFIPDYILITHYSHRRYSFRLIESIQLLRKSVKRWKSINWVLLFESRRRRT